MGGARFFAFHEPMPKPPLTRRDFLRQSSLAAASLAIGTEWRGRDIAQRPARRVRTELSVGTLGKFVDPLFVPPIAKPTGWRATPHAKTPFYTLPMRAVDARVHRDVPMTRFWSFGDSFPGPTIEARRGEGFWIDWVNELPDRHFLPIDHTIHGAEAGLPDSRAVVHVHGARVRPEHDGYPEHWKPAGQTASFYYPNDQDAATLWYHDHTMGINRLNVYAGLFGAYLIRDEEETRLALPSGAREWPLMICDRTFDTSGQLVYPDSGDPDAPWVPEVYGDAILVNGGLFPFAEVEPAAYRLRVVNASNGRFLHLSFTDADSAPTEIAWRQIGGDQGLLDHPAPLKRLDLLPAERADVVVDFSRHAGRRIRFMNDSGAILEWRVAATKGTAYGWPITLRPIERLRPLPTMRTRTHVLGEMLDRLNLPMRMLINGKRWHDPVTETPTLGSTEVWNLVNVTDDAHPIHLHLVRFQILDRRPFDVFGFQNKQGLKYVGPAIPPEPGESGWKDTVRAEPGMVTRIVVQFDGFAGRYMWHCHLLEHGDNEMMRPMEIVA